MKRFLSVILAIVLALSSAVTSFAVTPSGISSDENSLKLLSAGEDLEFTVKKTSGKMTITKVSDKETEYVYIPSEIDGEEVESIGDSLFRNSDSLKNVIIEDGITTISAHSFYGCENLCFVYIPDSVTTISSTAFDKCNENLTFMCEEGSKAQSYAEKEKFNVVTDIHIHADGNNVFVIGEIVEPEDCDTAGYVEIVCEGCPESFTYHCEIPAEGHDFSSKWTIDVKPTCEEPGYKSKHCENCDEVTDVTEIDPEHDFNKKVIKNATCKVPGLERYECEECGEIVEEEIPTSKGTHDYGDWIIQTPKSCILDGKRYRLCDDCGKREEEVIEATGTHDFGSWVVDRNPVCAIDGQRSRTCEDCGAKETEVIKASGTHNFGAWSTSVNVGCTTDGQKVRSCTVCGYRETEAVKAAGSHTYGNWVVVTPATLKSRGSEKRTCTVCSYTESRATAPLGMEDTAIAIEEKGTAYTLFYSGHSGGSGVGNHHYYEGTFDNGGSDLYADNMETMIIGTGFRIDDEVTEIAEVSITSFDTDEESGERDAIYLVDDTQYSRVCIGALSGMDWTWNTTTLRIDPSLFKEGHSYHFELSEEVSGWVVWIRSVAITFSGISKSGKGVREASLSASIDDSGKVTMSLTASSFEENDDYVVEFKAVESTTSYQRGGIEGEISLGTTPTTKEFTMNLEKGSPEGIYQIYVSFRKGSSLSTKFTSSTTAGYSLLAVSYSSNGGTNNVPIDTNSYKKGDNVNVLFDYIPSRQDYEFCGWAHNQNAKEPDYVKGENSVFTISNNTTLYAVWKEAKRTTFDYKKNSDGTITIEKYTGTETHVVIPDEIDGKKVVGISDFAFKDCDFVVEITIHADIKFIGKGVFVGCSSLKNIFVDDDSEYFCDVDGVLYNKDMTILICYPAAKGGNSYSVPVTVITITDYAFYGNVYIKIIIVGDIKKIGDYAFSGCIYFENIERIDGEIFVITDIEIGIGIFSETKFLTIYTGYHGGYYNNVLYYFSIVFTGVAYIHPGTTKIEHSVFRGSELTDVVLNEGLVEIADYAFYDCDKLTSITVPSTVKKIGSYAFAECDNLRMVIIPEPVEYIGEKAFENSPNAVIYGVKDSYAHKYAKENSIPFKELETEYAKYVYRINADLTITIVCYIGGGNEIIIPEKIGGFVVTGIHDGAFNGCANMTIIRIPSTVTYISKFAFVGCKSLLNIIVDESNTSYYTINGVLYCYDGNQLICFPQGIQMKGYVFAGWFTEDGKLIDFDSKDELDFDSAIYAKWLPAEKSIVMQINSTDATVFGKDGKTDVAPVIISGRTMLPIRFLSENLGAQVAWDSATRTVTITYGEKEIKLIIDRNDAYINGEKVELDIPATILDGRTVVPVRFVAEALGSKVEWVAETKQVIIIKGK